MVTDSNKVVVAVTPRHYLSLINQFLNLYHEERTDLKKQQLCLDVKLNNVEKTMEQVEEMQRSLAVESEAANLKLKQIAKDQNKAEQKENESGNSDHD